MPPFSPAPNPASPLASIRGDHAGARVLDFKTAGAWYAEKLDFRDMGSTQQGGLLASAADDTFQLEFVAGPGAVDRPPYNDLHDSLHLHGWHHVAPRVDSVDDTLAELRRRDVTIVAEPFDAVELRRRLAFFADPWGADPWSNVFEVTQPIAA